MEGRKQGRKEGRRERRKEARKEEKNKGRKQGRRKKEGKEEAAVCKSRGGDPVQARPEELTRTADFWARYSILRLFTSLKSCTRTAGGALRSVFCFLRVLHVGARVRTLCAETKGSGGVCNFLGAEVETRGLPVGVGRGVEWAWRRMWGVNVMWGFK